MEILKVVLTSLLSAAELFIIAKIIGHKQVAQLDFFDYITGITIGSIGAELATELEEPLKPLVAMVVYGVVTLGLAFAASKFPKSRKYINGTPTILMSGGRIYRKNLKKAKLDLSEFMLMCRQAGFFNLDDIAVAVFEYNGKLSVLPKATRRPATPEDMNLIPRPEVIFTEVIMDGRILGENLYRLGLDEKWLQNELALLGKHSAKEVLLGICDDQKRLQLYDN